MRGPETARVPPSHNAAPFAPAPDASPGAPEPGQDPGVFAGVVQNLTAWRDDIRRLARDHLELASLELQRATRSLVTIVVCGLLALLLVTATWFGLMAAIAIGLTALGLAAGWAILLVALLNLAGAAVCLIIIRGRTPYLKFPATAASLKPGPAHAAGKEGM